MTHQEETDSLQKQSKKSVWEARVCTGATLITFFLFKSDPEAQERVKNLVEFLAFVSFGLMMYLEGFNESFNLTNELVDMVIKRTEIYFERFKVFFTLSAKCHDHLIKPEDMPLKIEIKEALDKVYKEAEATIKGGEGSGL